jgi:AcrR family transcriptional regulator
MNKRRKSIVDHSLALFRERGVRNTSVQDIIERAGISKGTFYNYFSSKNECISALLEMIRYETSLDRIEMLIGKDARDLDLLIEQIIVLSKVNERYGMSAIYEELLYSGDEELRKLVLKHRVSEFEWLAQRLVEVFGEELRPHAYECSILFYGMFNHLMFARKLVNLDPEVKLVSTSVFHYLKFVAHCLIHDHTAVLQHSDLEKLKNFLEATPIRKQDAIELLRELLQEPQLTLAQRELTQALLFELEQKNMRRSVTAALLKSFREAFEDSPESKQAKEISTMVWYYLKQR